MGTFSWSELGFLTSTGDSEMFQHQSTKISSSRAGCNRGSCMCECRGTGSPWNAAAGMGDIWDCLAWDLR